MKSEINKTIKEIEDYLRKQRLPNPKSWDKRVEIAREHFRQGVK